MQAGVAGIRGQAVLAEMERTARGQHAVDLGQGGLHVRDRAQRTSHHHRIEASIVGGDSGAVEAQVVERDTGRGGLFPRVR